MCLTCGARARSVVKREVVRTQHGRSAGMSRESMSRKRRCSDGAWGDSANEVPQVKSVAAGRTAGVGGQGADSPRDLQFLFRVGAQGKRAYHSIVKEQVGRNSVGGEFSVSVRYDEIKRGRGEG